MGILRMTSPTSREFECEITNDDIKTDGARLVRPCHRYKEMYKSCRSFRGRLHQYYVYGELFDCNKHKENYDACMNYRETKDFSILEKVIQWERDLIETRVNAEKQNQTWEFRTQPPDDFNSPLPEFLARRQANSTFKNQDSR